MTEREALEAALKLVREIREDQLGPSYPGRLHRLRNEQIPKLLEIIEEGLSDE